MPLPTSQGANVEVPEFLIPDRCAGCELLLVDQAALEEALAVGDSRLAEEIAVEARYRAARCGGKMLEGCGITHGNEVKPFDLYQLTES